MDIHPDSITSYRQATERRKSMGGIMAPSFVCRKCKQPRLIGGRKKCKGEGWICAECAGGAK